MQLSNFEAAIRKSKKDSIDITCQQMIHMEKIPEKKFFTLFYLNHPLWMCEKYKRYCPFVVCWLEL